MQEGLSESVLQRIVAEDAELFFYFGNEDVLLEYCDKFLSNHIGEIFTQSIDASCPDHHVFLLNIPTQFFGEGSWLIDHLFSWKLYKVEGLVNIAEL